MQSVHSQTLRRLVSAILLAVCVFAGAAVNRLHSPRASMEAPQGMAYDSSLSAAMGMDVFRCHSGKLIFAIGEQQASGNLSAESLARALAPAGGKGWRSIAVKGRRKAFTGTGRDGHTVFATADHPAGSITVVLIVGDISQAEAERFIATLTLHEPA